MDRSTKYGFIAAQNIPPETSLITVRKRNAFPMMEMFGSILDSVRIVKLSRSWL